MSFEAYISVILHRVDAEEPEEVATQRYEDFSIKNLVAITQAQTTGTICVLYRKENEILVYSPHSIERYWDILKKLLCSIPLFLRTSFWVLLSL